MSREELLSKLEKTTDPAERAALINQLNDLHRQEIESEKGTPVE